MTSGPQVPSGAEDANGAAAPGELYFSSPKAKDAFKRVKAIVALEKGRQVANFLERKHE